MSEDADIRILPYTRTVGQEQLRLALELAYIEPRISGVLISGERGTGKSTVVRAFSQMVYGTLPVTIPINATEDRVVGGWQINELVHGEAVEQAGLLEEANDKMLYIDEVNLLDDHIVNIILDVTSTNILVIQRQGIPKQKQVQFTLIGTMNPEEGSLRPQLLDRFGLMVRVSTETDAVFRRDILKAVLKFDEALFRQSNGLHDPYWEETHREVDQNKEKLKEARNYLHSVDVPDQILECCATVAYEFKAEGHRSERLMVLAARAFAARQGRSRVTREHVEGIAHLVLQHRRGTAKQLNRKLWSDEDKDSLSQLLTQLIKDHE